MRTSACIQPDWLVSKIAAGVEQTSCQWMNVGFVVSHVAFVVNTTNLPEYLFLNQGVRMITDFT